MKKPTNLTLEDIANIIIALEEKGVAIQINLTPIICEEKDETKAGE